MKIYIVIPAHNEEAFLEKTLASLAEQTLIPSKIVVVNDGSTDDTQKIINTYSAKYPFISIAETASGKKHEPGSKVVNAFYQGLETLDSDYDIICKFDADLIFPSNYLEMIASTFQKNKKAGMVGGFCHIEKNGEWELENLTNKDHIRGALKAYRKECFLAIGGLKKAMGWDTIDELLAKFHNWEIVTHEALKVKHLKPTGASYTKAAKYKQGKAFYQMRYGWALTQIAALKLASKKGNVTFYFDYMRGYLKAKRKNTPFLVSETEGEFIRKLRWKNIRRKIL